MNESETADRTTILVCVTCRASGSPDDAPRAGAVLAQATAVAASVSGHSDIRVQTIRCLGNCSRGPSALIRHANAWTYIFGGLDPARDAESLIAGARLLASSPDGLMPWRGRPEPLKRGLIARVPPIDFRDDAPGE